LGFVFDRPWVPPEYIIFAFGYLILNKKVFVVTLIIKALTESFNGRTDINSLIDYLYKDLKLLSQRKARTGINYLINNEKLIAEKVSRTTFVTVVG